MPQKRKPRADGRYEAKVYLGRNEEGKKLYKAVYAATPRELEDAILDLRIKLKKGIDVTAERETFGDWAKRFLHQKEGSVGASQKQSYEGYIAHLNKTLEFMQIGKIKTYDVQDVIDRLAKKNPHTKKPSAKKTLNDVKITAVQIFQLALQNDVIVKNPADAVTIPEKAPKTSRRALTVDEQKWITETPHDMQRAAMIMLYAGLRRGELIPLLWSDIDLKNKTIAITKTVEMIDGHPVVKDGAKTEAGTRVITIPQKLVDFLVNESKNNFLVCPSNQAKMYSQQAWKCAWNSYLLDLDVLYGKRPQKKSKFDNRYPGITIPRFTAHWLRHTYATMLYHAGIDVLTAKEQLGHSDIKTTLGIYTHLDAAHKKRTMQQFDVYLGSSEVRQETAGGVEK